MCYVEKVYRHLLERVGGSTDTSRTSLDIWRMLLSCDQIRLCRHSLTSILTWLRSMIGVNRQERRHGGWRMAIYYGTLGCLTLWFCHFFQEIFKGQQMKRRSLHNSRSSTRREGHLIPMRWLAALLPTLMSSWVLEPWAMVWVHAPC